MKLSEEQWARVFEARCKSKQGQKISEEERVLLDAAHEQDEKRYAAMDLDVFNATSPFGSTRHGD
jgi:hypothetical protein